MSRSSGQGFPCPPAAGRGFRVPQQWARLYLSLNAFVICSFGNSHSDWGELEYERSFNLNFPDHYEYWILFQILIGHLYAF